MLKSLFNSLDSSVVEILDGIKYIDQDMVEISLCSEREAEYVSYVVSVTKDGNFDVLVEHQLKGDSDEKYHYVDAKDLELLERVRSDIHYWLVYSSYNYKSDGGDQ